MKYNFTDDVRRVLTMAREESDRPHHEYLGTNTFCWACSVKPKAGLHSFSEG